MLEGDAPREKVCSRGSEANKSPRGHTFSRGADFAAILYFYFFDLIHTGGWYF